MRPTPTPTSKPARRIARLLREAAFVASCALTAAACSADSGASQEAEPCSPGEARPCTCSGGASGSALCVAGTLAPCVCIEGNDVSADERSDAPPDVGFEVVERDAERDSSLYPCETPARLYPDADGDGQGERDAASVLSCVYVEGTVDNALDCDDTDRFRFTGAPELCDGVDNDCDVNVDEATAPVRQWPDVDGDGHGDRDAAPVERCERLEGHVLSADDCDDDNADVHPGTEDTCNDVDDDCDDRVDEDATLTVRYRDLDDDGFGGRDGDRISSCAPRDGYVDNNADCNDGNSDASPDGVEVCNFIDDNCDGLVDEGTGLLLLYPDRDGDSFGDSFHRGVYSCAPLAAHVADRSDCDDSTHLANPFATERCNGADDDCNGLIDDGALDRQPFYADADGDGWGVASSSTVACLAPGSFVDRPGDCDDRSDSISPDDAESCNFIDDDCDGSLDEGVANRCGGCGAEPTEVCGDFVDNDCDGGVDESGDGCFCDGRTNQQCYTGTPSHLGVGICRGGIVNCVCPGGARFCTNGQWGTCIGEVLPQVETCNEVDDDCDGRIDEGLRNRCGACGPLPAEVCDAADNDCDGSVDEGVALACGGCIVGGAPELCGDGFDNDCDGLVDEECDCTTSTGVDACYPGPPDTLGVGLCRAGTRQCYATALGAAVCDGAVLPSLEVCDGEDNSCDGLVDRLPNGCSVCGPETETCDGNDNDCDGFIDETLRNACGQCFDEVTPEELGGPPQCNLRDDDCDGFIDEGLVNACGTCDDSCYTDGWRNDDEFRSTGNGDGIVADSGLRLNTRSFRFADLWVANSGADTVTRIDTNTGAVVGTYPVGIHGGSSDDSPSRTAIDLDGNAWVANRAFDRVGSVTKIRGGDCVTDCVMFNVSVGGNNALPRALAIDANNDVWVGNFNERRAYHLDGDNGALIASYDLPIRPYGFAIDRVGIIWVAGISDAAIAAFDTRTRTALGPWAVPGSGPPYGIAVDGAGNVWFGTWTQGRLGRADRATFDATGSPRIDLFDGGTTNARGVAVDADGFVWIIGSGNNTIAKFDPRTNTFVGRWSTCTTPIGAGVATDGNVWTMCHGSNQAQQFGPSGSLLRTVGVGANPYSYSDVTGFALRAFTAPSGTWTQTFECGFATCGIDQVRWTAVVPAGTTLAMRARTQTAAGVWSAWSSAFSTSPANTRGLPDGTRAQIEITMTTTRDELTPVVTSVDVDWQRP